MFGIGAGLTKGIVSVATKMFMAAASEAMIKWLLFFIAEQVVKSTKTPHDDMWLAKMKREYEGKSGVGGK